ncbi:hypothetical protein USDA257_p06330 (plasmid) [Sinorhizobium fredii USDA 257]|uniref:Uncharacterized protein n=1 Tax=Sinorhizobium fredii (strain USDA 257) TaxID=1185652 RepID=I3XHI5_SINF2|nr:hypothetical protein USDA257_p06330 [Sinorhizobium fredii USDA 257]
MRRTASFRGEDYLQPIASQKGGSWPEELLPAEGHDQDPYFPRSCSRGRGTDGV